MADWRQALTRTRAQVAGALGRLLRGGGDHGSPADELEEALLSADVPARLAEAMLDAARAAGGGGPVPARLRSLLADTLGETPEPAWGGSNGLRTILLVGVNGSGKTTTCAKLARQVQRAGGKPLLGATDTYRAAGAEQLRLWAERIGCDVVTGAAGADAAAVAFDALDAATARAADVLVLDTAGRMHTRQPLMEELQKMTRALAKRRAGAPEDTWLVLDGSMGQNALVQARRFHEAVKLSGVVVTKLDGSYKAGFLLGIRQELEVPIRYVGLGEGEDDLVAFDPAAFVDGLLGFAPAAGESSP